MDKSKEGLLGFVLDERLASSSFFIEDWPLCRVALKSDRTWPWLYLVPRRDNIREICELSVLDQVDFIREVAMAQQALQILYKPEKINTAALGNMVPQLHVHVFARYKDDRAWPQPVWAVQAAETPYTDQEKQAEIQKLKKCFEGLRRGDKAACHQ
ncbi:MAG: HIT domain-containing protein [Alphaproteobacteria bacterium]|nr:MAG: HIT domain-containing protein [Alphaproteobacteria bacterium]